MNKDYWRENKERILSLRRKRYAEDSEYRNALLERNRKHREGNRGMRAGILTMPKRYRNVLIDGEYHKFINKAEFARYVGFSRETIDGWHKAGILAPVRVEWCKWYPLEMVHDILAVIGFSRRKFKKAQLKIFLNHVRIKWSRSKGCGI